MTGVTMTDLEYDRRQQALTTFYTPEDLRDPHLVCRRCRGELRKPRGRAGRPMGPVSDWTRVCRGCGRVTYNCTCKPVTQDTANAAGAPLGVPQ